MFFYFDTNLHNIGNTECVSANAVYTVVELALDL